MSYSGVFSCAHWFFEVGGKVRYERQFENASRYQVWPIDYFSNSCHSSFYMHVINVPSLMRNLERFDLICH